MQCKLDVDWAESTIEKIADLFEDRELNEALSVLHMMFYRVTDMDSEAPEFVTMANTIEDGWVKIKTTLEKGEIIN